MKGYSTFKKTHIQYERKDVTSWCTYANKDDSHHHLPTHIFVWIQGVTYREWRANTGRARDDTHAKDEADPADALGRTNSPENERSWAQKKRNNHEPKAMLWLSDTARSTRISHSKPITHPPAIECSVPTSEILLGKFRRNLPNKHANQRAEVGQSHKTCSEVIGLFAED